MSLAIVKALEDEEYNLGSRLSLSTDSTQLSTADRKIIELKSAIDANIKRYNQIVNNLNTILSEVKTEIDRLNYKFNTELINELNTLGTETLSKITNYKFLNLDGADGIMRTYSSSKDSLLLKMKKNLEEYSNRGITTIKKEVEKICNQFKLCDTKNKIQLLYLETTKNMDDLCTSYTGLSTEIMTFNNNEARRYKNELDELNRKNEEIKKKNADLQKEIDVITKRNNLKETLNSKVMEVEDKAISLLKKVNSVGKTLDISQYYSLVKEYNNLELNEKMDKLSEIVRSANKLNGDAKNLMETEKGFTVFFKKIYYTLFGKKQKFEFRLNLEEEEEVPELIPKLPNEIVPAKKASLGADTITLFSEVCGISGTSAANLRANDMEVDISEKDSEIKTTAEEPEKSCFDENGQRTTQCCDGDEYKFREELYPVIFVHGHVMEISRGDVQSSLGTFDYISDYFSRNGYVEKSLLYPESSEELVKGTWAYCNKPVVIRLTYYEGLKSGTTHNYKESIADYSPILKREIESVLKATNKDKVIIVAHSMGGILSRYYIQENEDSNNVYKLITLGSPHYGIRAGATVLSWTPLSAKESKQMTHNSDFLDELNNPNDCLVPTYTISGNSERCVLEYCDGLVYVENSKLKMAKGSKVFTGKQYKHRLMLRESDVAQQVLNFVKD